MIFKPELIKQIKAGRKTQTRRPFRPADWDEALLRFVCRHEVGDVRALQPGRGKQATGHITITAVRAERVGHISYEDARAEGFRTTQEFLAYWQRLYGKGWSDQRENETDEQFGQRSRDMGCWPALSWTPVWVIAFDLGITIDQPRLLAARPGFGDYVTEPAAAMPREPEAVTAAEVHEMTKEAGFRDRGRRADPDIRLRQELQAALDRYDENVGTKRSNREVARTVRSIRQQIKVLDLKIKAA